jgi:hypothetical protein
MCVALHTVAVFHSQPAHSGPLIPPHSKVSFYSLPIQTSYVTDARECWILINSTSSTICWTTFWCRLLFHGVTMWQ